MRKAMLAGCAALLFTAGCEGNRIGSGAAIGGALGAVAGNVAGSAFKGGGRGRGARTLGTIVGGGIGTLAGASIGSMLDARDRERQQAATMAVLRQPLPPHLYQAAYGTTGPGYTPRSNQAQGYGRYAPPPSRSYGSADTRTGSSSAPAPATSAPAPSSRLPNVPSAGQVKWVSTHSGASGSSTIVDVQPPRDGRGECRTVQEVAQKAGQQATDTTTHCESAPGAGDWSKV